MIFFKKIWLFFFLLLAGCAPFSGNGGFFDREEYMSIAGESFRKAGAPNADILRVGIKKSGMFEPVFMPVLGKEIPVYLSTEAFNETSQKAAIDLGAKVGSNTVQGEANIADSTERSSKGTYKVFSIRDVSDLIGELNSEANSEKIREMSMYQEPRIIVAVAIAFGHESIINKSQGGKLGLSTAKITGAPEVKLSGNTENISVLKLSDGTTFAYKLARLCWKEYAADKIIIGALDSDSPSADNKCPAGTFKSVIALRQSKEKK